MKFFSIRKDGGPDSNVTGYWLIEIKWLFSIALLRFSKGSRENFHAHAFNAISWIFKGEIQEELYAFRDMEPVALINYKPSFMPVVTRKNRMHRVRGVANATWALTFRGPWANFWHEITPEGMLVELTHGRKVRNVRPVDWIYHDLDHL